MVAHSTPVPLCVCPSVRVELAVKVIVAALMAFLTALGTTSCMGYGPVSL